MKKSKADLVRGWLEKARRDLQVAINELGRPEPLTDIICFHAQQAAEKYLKAYKTHDLEDLVLLAGQKDPGFLALKDEVALLTPYAVETRYPEFEEPSLDDAKEAVEIAKKVKEFVLKRLLEHLPSSCVGWESNASSSFPTPGPTQGEPE